jgi:hypothetical protein
MKRNNLKDFFEDRLKIKQMGKILGGALPQDPKPDDEESAEQNEG